MAKQISKVIDKKIKVEETTSHYSLKSIIVLIICVLVVFFGFYLFTLRMTKKNDIKTCLQMINQKKNFQFIGLI